MQMGLVLMMLMLIYLIKLLHLVINKQVLVSWILMYQNKNLLNAQWLTYGCIHVLDVVVFCVGDGDNLVEEGDEEDEGKENQIDFDGGDNGCTYDGDIYSNNANIDD